MTPEERFWSKVDKRGPEDCWEWTAGKFQNNYGQVWWRGRPRQAHRVALELTNGPIPAGMHVLHSCDNRGCCNPDHLRTGTHADNMADKMIRGTTRCWGTQEGERNRELLRRRALGTISSR